MQQKFCYAKLRGKIREVCGTQKVFAEKMGLFGSGLSYRLSGKTPFLDCDMEKAVEILGINKSEIADYFFGQKFAVANVAAKKRVAD